MPPRGCSCDCEELVVRFANGDGTFTYPPVVDGVVTIPNPATETPFTAVAGDGIDITPDGTNGHAPVIEVCAAASSPIPVGFTDGCLSVGPAPASPTWTSPNQTPQGGIRVIAGGTLGHMPTFTLAFAPGAPFQINADGLLEFTGSTSSGFTCSDLNTCPVQSLSNVTAGADGQLAGWQGGELVPVDSATGCVTFAGAPIDAAGDFAATAPAASGFPEFHMQCVTNGVTGSELWTVLADTFGDLQWHQIA